jgi:hypothetical protein
MPPTHKRVGGKSLTQILYTVDVIIALIAIPRNIAPLVIIHM